MQEQLWYYSYSLVMLMNLNHEKEVIWSTPAKILAAQFSLCCYLLHLTIANYVAELNFATTQAVEMVTRRD